MKQVHEAIHDVYFHKLRDVTTNTMDYPILYNLKYLFTNYGEIEPKYVNEQSQAIRDMELSGTESLIALWGAIEDLEQLGISSGVLFYASTLDNHYSLSPETSK